MAQEREYKGKLLRLFREIMLLTRSPMGLTINEMADKLRVSYRTVYRDLQVLEQVGFMPIEVGRGRYVIRDMDRDTKKFEKNLVFNAEEAGLLARALSGIPENNPLKKVIMEKMLAFSGMEDVMKTIVKKDISRNMELLAKAIREKRLVTFHNYRSSHSRSIRNRVVEPYTFSTDGVFVKAFEIDSGTNKTFKIERIEEVVLQSTKWKNEKSHEQEEAPDIFGINSGPLYHVRLRMTLTASNLLEEEFPKSKPCIVKEDASYYLFDGEVHTFKGIGRFILGLIEQIEVIEPQELKEFLEDKISRRKF